MLPELTDAMDEVFMSYEGSAVGSLVTAGEYSGVANAEPSEF